MSEETVRRDLFRASQGDNYQGENYNAEQHQTNTSMNLQRENEELRETIQRLESRRGNANLMDWVMDSFCADDIKELEKRKDELQNVVHEFNKKLNEKVTIHNLRHTNQTLENSDFMESQGTWPRMDNIRLVDSKFPTMTDDFTPVNRNETINILRQEKNELEQELRLVKEEKDGLEQELRNITEGMVKIKTADII